MVVVSIIVIACVLMLTVPSEIAMNCHSADVAKSTQVLAQSPQVLYPWNTDVLLYAHDGL